MIDTITISLILVVIGLILMIAEAFSPGVYLIIPGTVLLIIGIIGYAFPDFLFTWMSPVVAVVIAIPITAVTVLGYRYLGKPEPPSTTVTDSLVGKEGIVTIKINTTDMRGKVKIGSDTWSAEADEDIPAGTAVIVDRSSGVHVHVKRK